MSGEQRVDAKKIVMGCTHGPIVDDWSSGGLSRADLACVDCIATGLHAVEEERDEGAVLSCGHRDDEWIALETTCREQAEEIARLREAIEFLFTPGPGMAVPEPYPEREEYEPHKKTWNTKLAKLRAALVRAPGPQ